MLKRDNKLLTDRVNLLTFALRPMLPATKAAMESGKVTKEEILKAALGLGQPEDEVLAMFNALDLDSDGTLDYEEFIAAYRDNGPCGNNQSDKAKRMATLVEMVAHPQWHLMLGVEEEEMEKNDPDKEQSPPLTHARWFQELEALVVQADPTTEQPMACSSEKKYTYALDLGLLVWDLCCCVLASRQRQAYVATCRASHLNPDNTHAVVAQFLDVAQAQAAAWSRAEAIRVMEAKQQQQHQTISEEEVQEEQVSDVRELPLVLGLQEWPGSGSAREAVYRAACVERGLHVVAPGDDVALAWSATVLPFSRSGAATAEPLRTSAKDADGHGAGWAALDLTSEGGWEGAAQAGAQAPTADLTGAHYLHRKTSLRCRDD